MSKKGAPETSATGQEQEVRRLQRDLARATQQIEQLQRRKTSLLAMAVHDLRTPLAIIQGYSQLLAADLSAATDTTALEYLTNIVAYSESLDHMIDNLVALDQMERGELHISVKPFDLSEVVGQSIAQVEGLALVKSLTMQFPAQSEAARVTADEEQIARVLYSLLSHAIKYARPGGALHVEIERDGDFVRVFLGDSQRSLDPDLLARLFDLVEVGRNGIASFRGMDMGLVLARYIAEAHGGRLVASCEPDKGVVFTLFLPASDQDGSDHPDL